MRFRLPAIKFIYHTKMLRHLIFPAMEPAAFHASPQVRHLASQAAIALLAATTVPAAVTDVPGNDGKAYRDATHNLNSIVGAGNSGRLLGNFITHWNAGAGSFQVPVDTNGFTLLLDTGNGNGGHVASGAISGSGSVTVSSASRISQYWNVPYKIAGAASNTFSGGTAIGRGTLVLQKSAGADALPGNVTLGSAGETARIVWAASNQFHDGASITVLLPSGTNGYAADAKLNFLDLAGFSETIDTLILPDAGARTQVRTGAGGVLTVTNLMVNGTTLPPGTYTSADGFVTGSGSVNVSGDAPPGESLVTASPVSIAADGMATSTIIVTLRDGTGNPDSGKTITLASSRGAADLISPASGLSDADGIVTFTVKSLIASTAVFTATNTSDGTVLVQTAAVTFTAASDVVDISNATTPGEPASPGLGVAVDATVGTGKTGRLVGLAKTIWWSHGFSAPLDLNGNTLIIDSGDGNACIATGTISGNGIVKIDGGGVEIIRIGGAAGNTYTGGTQIVEGGVRLEKASGNALCGSITVSDGGIIWGADHQIDDTSPVVLANRNIYLNFAGKSETMGNLTVDGDSNLFLGAGTSIIRFANSSGQSWSAGKQLIIREWNGSATGGGAEQVFFGSTSGGLASSQVSQVGFMNPAGFPDGLYHAAILPTGELVPVGTPVVPVSPPYDLSASAMAARTDIYTSNGRADLTATGTPLTAGTRIAFFGDSITWQNNYISRIDAALASGAGTQGKNITLINRGINGGGVLQIRDGAPDSGYPGSTAQASFASLLTSDQADIAVVFIGINDVWWRGTSAAGYEQALRDLAASAGVQGVKLVFATISAHFESPVGADPLEPAIDQFSALIRTVAAETDATLVDLRAAYVAYWQNYNYEIRLDGGFSTIQPSGILTYDGVHPTALGNDMLADHLAAGILTAITPRSAFDVWIAGKGLSGADAEFGADPDGDGIPNGIELVIGGEPNPSHPQSNSCHLLPAPDAMGDDLRFTYQRMHESAALQVEVEFNTDLAGPWRNASEAGATIEIHPGTLSDSVTVILPKSSASRQFARLAVTHP